MKIYFVRHGETDMNKNNMFYGWYDEDINEKVFLRRKICVRLLRIYILIRSIPAT